MSGFPGPSELNCWHGGSNPSSQLLVPITIVQKPAISSIAHCTVPCAYIFFAKIKFRDKNNSSVIIFFMKLNIKILITVFTLSLFYFVFNLVKSPISSDPDCNNPNVGDIDYCLTKIQNEINALSPAHENNKKELSDLNAKISSIKKQINNVSYQVDNLEKEIFRRDEELAFTRQIFESKAFNHYKFIRSYDPLLPFFSSNDATNAIREIILQQKAADNDRLSMESLVDELFALKSDKDNLEKQKNSLSIAQKSLDERASFLGGEVNKVESYLTTLSSKQQALIAAKSGGFTASVGDSDLVDDYYASIKGFREAAPAGSFAVFSFGGYTHRKGMSQYGARGRAENGQNYISILNAYYGVSPVNKDTNGNIIVNGASMNFEDYYLMGIAEMPSSWHKEALKAQAVAARTYAYRYKIEGKSICTTESCQVFSSSKANNPPDAWRQAVQETRGQILENVTTYYSSTSGGYLLTSGWDTTDGSGGSDFVNKAWEAKGGSPWLYKAWYREGYTSSGNTCGVSDPWLNNEEFTDIINAALALRKGNDDRITSITTSCWPGNPYSYSELRSIGGVERVDSINVVQGDGFTNSVIINGNITLSGDEFKQAFNLRAPGFLMIPQKGFAFFNIEKK